MGKGLVDLQSMGQRIKHLRCSMNYTQERFAAQINISTSYLASNLDGVRAASKG